jgi:hypothetical protein
MNMAARAVVMLATIVPAFDGHAEGGADWTALTLARSGAWGISTAPMRGTAIAAAIRQCRAMTNLPSDCGAHYIVRRGAWIVGLVCGGHKISVAASTLEETVRAARKRHDELGMGPAPDLMECTTVLVISPTGASAIPLNVFSTD